jgi:glutaredoxin-like YruB-family protein
MRLLTLLIAIAIISATLQANATIGKDQSPINPKAKIVLQYPRIVLYSVSWCPHCRAAKEYFTHNNIPFINRDVELDPQAMEELTQKYKSQAVPVIVIGDDGKILKGFNEESVGNAIKEMQGKMK